MTDVHPRSLVLFEELLTAESDKITTTTALALAKELGVADTFDLRDYE